MNTLISLAGALSPSSLTGWLLLIALLEALVVLSQILCVLLLSTRNGRKRAMGLRFREQMTPRFLDAVEDPSLIPDWIRRSRGFPRELSREFLEGWILRTTGRFQERSVRVYRESGFLAEDLRLLSSRSWKRRMLALRRLLRVAGPDEIEAILRLRETVYPNQIMSASILGRLRGGEALLGYLNTLNLPRRMMEQPLVSLLKGLPQPTFEELVAGWARLQSPSVRRVLLSITATHCPAELPRLLSLARQDPDLEVRIGACQAASRVWSREGMDLLLEALRDERWELRAQAARALGALGDPAALEVLTLALEDKAFWVRQNAAASLLELGDEGRGRLMRATRGADAFAADAARQELERECSHASAWSA